MPNPNINYVVFYVAISLILVGGLFWFSNRRKSRAVQTVGSAVNKALGKGHETFKGNISEVRAIANRKMLLAEACSSVAMMSTAQIEQSLSRLFEDLSLRDALPEQVIFDLRHIPQEIRDRMDAARISADEVFERYMSIRHTSEADSSWLYVLNSLVSCLICRLTTTVPSDLMKEVVEFVNTAKGTIVFPFTTAETDLVNNPSWFLRVSLANPDNDCLGAITGFRYRFYKPGEPLVSDWCNEISATGINNPYRRLRFGVGHLYLVSMQLLTETLSMKAHGPGISLPISIPFGDLEVHTKAEQVLGFKACTPAAMEAINALGDEGVRQRIYRAEGFLNVELRQGNRVVVLSDATAYLIDTENFDDIKPHTLVEVLKAAYVPAPLQRGSAKLKLGLEEVHWFYNTEVESTLI